MVYIPPKYNYMYDVPIIPLGDDCHTTMLLQKLNLRKHQLAFDWIASNPAITLFEVAELIATDFLGYTDGISIDVNKSIRNFDGYSFRFGHFPELLTDSAFKEQFKQRHIKFQQLIRQDVVFLFSVLAHLITKVTIQSLYDSILKFNSLMLEGQLLAIYIKYENDASLFDGLLKLNRHKKIRIILYHTNFKQFGVFDSVKQYANILYRLGVDIKQSTSPIERNYNEL